ncbi:hypothetical protein ABZU25_16840 [Micromonospora sp. NPDC005215]|uniref:hypothetical protein n=1 Tax=Micromonospora sp. NPDC005215 TaxID=3157024 RepID=UPI0033A65137
MSVPGNLPTAEPGALLRLGPDDWSFGRDLTPGTHVDVVVAWLRTDLAHLSEEWVWVRGHRPQCDYPKDDLHPPCMELRVSVAALRRIAPTP